MIQAHRVAPFMLAILGATFSDACGSATDEPGVEGTAGSAGSSGQVGGTGNEAPAGGGGVATSSPVGVGGSIAAAGHAGAGGATASGGHGGTGGSVGSAGSGSMGGSTGAGGSVGTGGSGGSGGPVVTGTPGVWENVTPAGLDPSISYGAQDVLADPVHAGTFYAFFCSQGVWKSTDFGVKWNKVSTDGNIEKGRPWGDAIAQDGSYMLAEEGVEGPNLGAWRSTDGGATWTSHSMGGNNDPYMFDIDPSNKNHVIGTMHSGDRVYESTDGGLTWSDRGSSMTGNSPYVFFVTSTSWLVMSQDVPSTRLSKDSGATWTTVATLEHFHGLEQIFIDPTNHDIYLPTTSGIYRSTDNAATFGQVSNAMSASVFATAGRLYAMGSSGFTGYQIATRGNGADWVSKPDPAGMSNGPKRVAAAQDTAANSWVLVGGFWKLGLWRMVEK